MAGLTDMAGLTAPFGQWVSLNGQNTLEIPQAHEPLTKSADMQAMAQALQRYLLTGQGPHPYTHAHNSHSDQRQYGPMPQTGNPWDSSGLPPYPPSLMNSMQQQLQAEPNMAPATQQMMQQFLNRNAAPAAPASQQIQNMLQRQPTIPPGSVLSPSEIM